MKTILTLLFIIFSIVAYHAQLATIAADGGETVVNWDAEIKKNKENEEEYPFIYGSGCTAGHSQSNGSSKLTSQGSSSYGFNKLHD
jgi:hypothetical protein